MKKYFFVPILFFCCVKVLAQKNLLWEPVTKDDQNKYIKLSNKESVLTDYKLFRLNFDLLQTKLDTNGVGANQEYALIQLPDISGQLISFKVVESSIMHPDLQSRYSSIRTYKGVGIEDTTATLRFSVSPLGFHALSLSGLRSALYIEPYSKYDDSLHMVFERDDINKMDSDFECYVETDLDNMEQRLSSSLSGAGDIDDQKLRKYRLALSCTGEYAQYFAGNGNEGQQKTNVLAAMITSVNRVNEIYERDLGIRLEFVANNDQVIYLNSQSDPWQNEFNTTTAQTLDNVIGVNNYDIGHNYNDSGGGNAGCLGCVCASVSQNNFHKGRGWTGSNNPVGDPFYIDYVAHEIGHQFYGFHTMNRCSRSGYNTEVEPGSGSSIMGYAGICAPNVQNQSDAHFNYVNIRDIGGYIKTGYNAYVNYNVGICENSVSIQNQPPTANAGNDYIIPANTPFVLTGLSTDADGLDTLTYNWSQNDTEQATDSNTPQSNWSQGPLYRSVLPSISPTRYFPKLETVVSGNLSSTWEVTPSVPRTINFAFTVRDNGSGFIGDDGTGQAATDLMMVEVVNTGAPFLVTSQAESDLSWISDLSETITWNVASTTSNGINADSVDILLSIDGGQNFDIYLATDIPNNGTAEITVPDISAASCRIMVKATNHIFYALNSIPFSVNYFVQTECYTYNSAENLNLDIPDGTGQNQFGDYLVQYFDINENIVISDVDFNIDITHGYIGDLNIVLQHPDGTQAVLLDSEYCDDENNLDITFNDQASEDIVCSNPTLGNYRPSGTPLSNFNGKSSLGTWALGIRDYYNEDAGVLNNFSLIFCENELILSTSKIELDQVLLYPNPVEGTLYINTLRNDLIYTLFDLNGREILYTSKKVIPMASLSNGVYVVKISSQNQSIYKRVIKK
jgi:subtilisin-like proprotein convertase family protein